VLYLELQRTGKRTVVRDCYAHVPLQVLRPVYLDDTGTASIYLLNPCGGVLGGDTYTITVTLQPGARVHLTTPSATKLYATEGAVAQQYVDFTLAAGAVLTYLPEQTIPFAHAAFRQQIRVRLPADACAFLGEIVAPGRVARGEAFAYREYSSSLHVEDTQGNMLLVERTRLQPQQQPLQGLGLLEGYDYLGTFYALSRQAAITSKLANDLHALLASRQRLLGSATLLAHGGVAVRLLATDHSSASQALYDVWDIVHRHTLGYAATPRRTW
jgi:urease accessory protein